MAPGDVAAAMGRAFSKLQGFMAQNQVTPVGPPLTVYKDWNGVTMLVEVGFPVNSVDLAKAAGDVFAGKSPEGLAVSTHHKGSYDALRVSYDKIEEEMKAAGLRPSGVSWEVYLKGPGTTEESDYETEIYMQLQGDADAGLIAS